MAIIELYKEKVLGIRKDNREYWLSKEEGLALVINETIRWSSIRVKVRQRAEKSYVVILGYFNNRGEFQELEKLVFNDIDAQDVEDIRGLAKEIEKIIRTNYKKITI